MCPISPALPPVPKLENRTALVTGAGSGIGRSVCEALAADGARVVAADCNQDAAYGTVSRLYGGAGRHVALQVDVSSEASVKSLFSRIRDSPGLPAVSIVVCCAGVKNIDSLVDTKPEAFDRVMSINLKGTFLTVQAAASEMLSRGVRNGAVVTVSSIVARTGLSRQQPSWPSRRRRRSSWRRTASAATWCCRASPDTAMTADVNDKDRAHVAACTPLGRAARPEEIARTIRFLCDEAESSFVTGAALDVTGGLHM
ncbi:hypothetical protein HPB49_026696 [Dermacentor silvarum]|nr:hypothetical protein HPB49_026696 [Dermacentor silvarum]